jgi:hypothetical protein
MWTAEVSGGGQIGHRPGKKRTKSITVADLCPPAANEVYMVFFDARHLGIPVPHQFDVLIHPIGLDPVEDDGVDVFPSRQDLGKAPLDVSVELLSLLRAVDESREFARSLRGILPHGCLAFGFCIARRQ